MIKRLFRAMFLVVAPSLAVSSIGAPVRGADEAPFRPPAAPLVTSDPYLSIWSEADHLTDDVTRHWTHRPHALVSLIRIDGKPYRLMGPEPKDVPAFPQTGLNVLPTRTIYDFDDSHVHVTLTFMTAALPHDLEALTRPLTYLTWQVKSSDGTAHEAALYDSTSSQLAVNEPDQKVEWSRPSAGGLAVLRAGTVDQPLLTPAGDDTRIDWGYLYVAASAAEAKAAAGASRAMEKSFIETGSLPVADDANMPRPAGKDEPALAFAFDLGRVGADPVSRRVIVAYDEIYSIKYFGKKLQPYWRRNGAAPEEMLQSADGDYPRLAKQCAAFDEALMSDMTKIGGVRYARIAALAYRQCLAATGIAADANKQPLLFTKENTSNGDIATVDVIFPMDPMLILLSPSLAKASLVPVLSYGASSHWKFPNAPHDLGAYPVARGTDDGGEGMPVEESGNMLILCDAIAQEEGSADWVAPWWPKLTQWAQYLEQFGLDPEEQLCTDDFMGHLAHNANLSVKAILGLAAYGDMCRLRGDNATAEKYARLARADAVHWMKVADAGNHSLLAFDKPNTWSQKYNLVWDKLLGLNVFPPDVAKKEVAFYKTVVQKYGVPLDSRTKLTKTDWSFWSATLADNQPDFESLIAPIYDYLNTTTARSPLADSYVTTDIHSDGMHARPVVGGLFIKMLDSRDMWKKWSAGDTTQASNWAPLPGRPAYAEVVPTSQKAPAIWRYTIDKPAEGWESARFDDSSWKEGPGAFGEHVAPGIRRGTTWKTSDIWLRRQVALPAAPIDNPQFLVYHDEDCEIYVDGTLACRDSNFNNGYELLDVARAAKGLLKPGAQITLAVHCHQTVGGQGIDVGIVNVKEETKP